ncbi:MAG: very short patch repair endonuclease [Pirellulales bacterium]
MKAGAQKIRVRKPSAARSANMAKIRCRDSGCEMTVRRLVHGLGYRFRLHDRTLPGTPDLVMARHSKVIFVNGCFWHRHTCKRGRSMPSSNVEFWQAKLEANQMRDRRARRLLKQQGWQVLTIWECQATDPEKLSRRIRQFIEQV